MNALGLRPFTGHVVRAERARRVVAPPYDALDAGARAALAATDPDSYLGALPPGGSPDEGALTTALASCRSHLDRLFAAGRYRAIGAPAVGVLVFGTGRVRATAIVGDVPVAAFADGRVLPHERVRDDRVHELARYLEIVGVASSPVALSQRPDAEVTAATAAATTTPPDVAYRADDGVDVALWCVTEPALRDRLCAAVSGAGVSFLADGHHRAAAAARHADEVGAAPEDAAGRVLCAVFPTDHLVVHPFHRRIDAALGETAPDADIEAMLDRLRARGVTITALDGPQGPVTAHTVTLTAAGRWWLLDARGRARTDDLVEALDARLVERDLVPLIAGDRAVTVVPVPAPLGLAALTAAGAVGLALYPPDIEELLAVSRAGRNMPPKTTYVTPKLRSGLVVTPRPRPEPRPTP